MPDNPKPIHTIRLGQIQAAVWSNPGQHGPFYNVTVERRYRDANEQWQGSTSFGRDDLLVLAKVADLAHTYICERQAESRSQSAETDRSPPAEASRTEVVQRRSR